MGIQGQTSNFYWCQGQANISTSLYKQCFLHRQKHHQGQGRDSRYHRVLDGLVPTTRSTLSALASQVPARSAASVSPAPEQGQYLLQQSNDTRLLPRPEGAPRSLSRCWLGTKVCIYKWRCIFLCYEYCVLQAACIINLRCTKIQSKLFKTLKKTLLCVHSDRPSVDSAYTHAQIISRVIRV